jgi:hypothetical protein
LTEISDFKELKKYVQKNDGVVTVGMHLLRQLQGAERLGNGVRAEIKNALDRCDLGFVGKGGNRKDLPAYSEDLVRLYARSSAVGRFIDAVDDLEEGGDERLREFAGDASAKLEQIREIVL